MVLYIDYDSVKSNGYVISVPTGLQSTSMVPSAQV